MEKRGWLTWVTGITICLNLILPSIIYVIFINIYISLPNAENVLPLTTFQKNNRSHFIIVHY
uniref:G_PROTEIN_RECEP_F1_2 domain-containing protein n=1 Tax=Heterorhabditis bacteriophora TaxID=37862 RepID=A0A1I7WEU9_HETBA